MINDIILMNGYGLYVWSAFSFTLISFVVLYYVCKIELVKEHKKFKNKFSSLDLEKIEIARTKETYKEILSNSSVSKI